eukprot:CAMPEP_0113324088 /NCGR_PEP_ID=MMETSP0010_2-20120614/16807_1 /TAXON_ID=216773 ORGANISM="Corethron hystrix, Strain 308" /NCGR_SAMPLE_ID=MMETSP0010_2 /ASSEMBLY_ACC=CAM_ASM_000155 /LENGTH=75 /DNA_ID=CAMNT_0000183341 /DNA_START=57 /DNA_END=280 /DNA_ORIENTATION=- /assembly_acc=CAM_ASM_000155
MANMSYRYVEEYAVSDFVTDFVDELVPRWTADIVPQERLLDASSLYFDRRPDLIREILDKYLTPQNSRIDILSSS